MRGLVLAHAVAAAAALCPSAPLHAKYRAPRIIHTAAGADDNDLAALDAAARAAQSSADAQNADAAAAPPPVRVAEQESGGTRWAWGRGEAEAPPSMTGAELLDVAARRAAADRAENDDDAAPRSDTAVKSQWEKTLNRDEKSHLGEIHAAAERERAGLRVEQFGETTAQGVEERAARELRVVGEAADLGAQLGVEGRRGRGVEVLQCRLEHL